MSKTTKKTFWIVWSILLVFTLVITFVPFHSHAAVTDPMTFNPASVPRLDQLPDVDDYEGDLGDYVDVNGNVYQFIQAYGDPQPLSIGTHESHMISITYGLTYNDILNNPSGCVEIIEVIGQPVAVLADLGGTLICAQSDGIHYGMFLGEQFMSFGSCSYPSSPNEVVQLKTFMQYTVSRLPSSDVFISHIRAQPYYYTWDLIHTHNLYEAVLEAPSCTEKGKASLGCTYCDILNIYNQEYELPATGHTFVESERYGDCISITVKSVCHCGETKTEVIDGAGHNYQSVYTPATSTQVGYTTYTCSACFDSYVVYDEWDCDVNGHSWIEQRRSQDCEHLYVHYDCAFCDSTKTDTFAGGYGHNLVESSSTGNCSSRQVTYVCSRGGCNYSTVKTENWSHIYGNPVVEGDCTLSLYTYTCSRCDHSYVDRVVGEHIWNLNDRADPTCLLDGHENYTCDLCGTSKRVNLPSYGGHNMELHSRIDPTCAQDGSEIYYCSRCSEMNVILLPATGAHTMELASRTDPTCTKDGIEVFRCSQCSHETSTTLSATGAHTMELASRTDPTCTQDGIEVYRCSQCSHETSTTLSATGHTHVESHRKTECLTITVTKTCSCGDTISETLPGPGHNYVSKFTPPTAETVGYTTFTCSGCSHSYIVYDDWDCVVQGHGWKEESRYQNCTHSFVDYFCPFCEETKTDKTTGGLGHDVIETGTTGSCTNCKVTYSCKRLGCNYSYIQTEKREHSFSQTGYEGTCDDAYLTFTCSLCNYSYTKNEVGAHDFEELERHDATCTTDGSVSYKCKSCVAIMTETLPMLGHTWVDNGGHDPSCTTEGHNYTKCSTCQLVNDEVLPALGHKTTMEIVTEDNYRIKRYTCTVCGNVTEERSELPQVPEVGMDGVSNFVLTFFGAIATFFLYLMSNVSFMGIYGTDLLAILAIVAFVVLLRKVASGGDN